MSLVKVIGVISGTSMDGIDVAMIETDGQKQVLQHEGRVYSYRSDLRAELQHIIETPELAEYGDLTGVEQAVSDAHADAVLDYCQDCAIEKNQITLVGLHGQTVFHRPERRFTRQLGIGQRMADRIGIDVVNRFRHADLANGGHGAPLVPLYHSALAHGLRGLEMPLMILNLGGVANVTYIDNDTIIAFDTGPASALLDDFMQRRRGLPFDRDGLFAAGGRVNYEMVENFMGHTFFDVKPPKSLDRQDFNARARIIETLADEDGAATLAAFTIHSVAAALRHVPRAPKHWLVAGGGRLNATFMQGLRAELKVPVEAVEAVGWNGDFLEAQCFAYLGLRSKLGLALSLPSTTGVLKPLTGGALWRV